MYYLDKARDIALNNEHNFHLVAWAKRGSSVVYGTNSFRCSTKFERIHPDGTRGFHLHAEMDLLRKFKPGTISEITVVRFSKDGCVTMSKPCPYCERFIKRHGVKKVNYTNWDGSWDVLRF